MSLIILDMGSGNTCGNSVDYAKKMIDTVAEMDSKKHRVWLKWQLEERDDGPNKHLDREVFKAAFEYGEGKGYQMTSSVFDVHSLGFLLFSRQPMWELPFIKIACRPDLYYLMGLVPRAIPLFVSVYKVESLPYMSNCQVLYCVPKYPATLAEYEDRFSGKTLEGAVSDHTPGLELWRKYKPQIWEKHFVLERDASNPDAGSFAMTPDQLKEVIG